MLIVKDVYRSGIDNKYAKHGLLAAIVDPYLINWMQTELTIYRLY